MRIYQRGSARISLRLTTYYISYLELQWIWFQKMCKKALLCLKDISTFQADIVNVMPVCNHLFYSYMYFDFSREVRTNREKLLKAVYNQSNVRDKNTSLANAKLMYNFKMKELTLFHSFSCMHKFIEKQFRFF